MLNIFRYSRLRTKTLQCCNKEVCGDCYSKLDVCPYCDAVIDRDSDTLRDAECGSCYKKIVIRDDSPYICCIVVFEYFIWICISFLIIMVPILVNTDSKIFIVIGIILTFVLSAVLKLVSYTLMFFDKIPCVKFIY